MALNKLDGPLGHISRGMPVLRIRRSIDLAPMLTPIRTLSVSILINEEAIFITAFSHRPLQMVPRYARAMIYR